MSEQNGVVQKAAPVRAVVPSSRDASAPAATREEKLDKEALVSWMTVRADPSRGKRRAVLFTLAHRTGANGEKVFGVTEGDVKTRLGDADRAARILELADDFDRAAREWVKAGCRGAQSFIVGAHRDENPETDAHETFPFSVTPPPELAQNFEGNERPDLPGALAQFQRVVDTLLRNDQRDKDRLVEIHRIDREHIERLHEIRERSTVEREELRDASALRHAQLKRTELEMEIMNKAVMKAIDLGMPLLAKAFGAEPAAENPMMAFAASLEPERIAALCRGLTPEQMKLADPVLAALLDKLPDDKKMRIAALMAQPAEDIKITVKPEGGR